MVTPKIFQLITRFCSKTCRYWSDLLFLFWALRVKTGQRFFMMTRFSSILYSSYFLQSNSVLYL